MTPPLPFDPKPVVNDFSIRVASVNGTGSQTANLIILRALFKMGIPVSAKNIFPSNIQGLPTWYHIRLSHEGFVAFRETSEVLVAFNERTVAADISVLPSKGLCLYPSEWKDLPIRDDIYHYAIPVKQFLQQAGIRGKIRDYVSNMVYVGALAWLLDIPVPAIDDALAYHFGDRQALIEQNLEVVHIVYDWSMANLDRRHPYRIESMDRQAGQLLITGNEAAALGSIFGGVTLASWYPITPSTSLIDALNDYLPRLRRDPETGKETCVVIQAEDELAAAGMIMGAGWAGARAMTATSGPGISLMSEFVSLGYFAEVPAVIWDIQRIGPSTGLPTRTSQGDILFAYYLGHGDTRNILLLPGTVAECFAFGTTAFNLAEELQTPVLVMSDLDLGMNTWATLPFDYPEPIRRGKVLTEAEVEEKGFGRWQEVDGDGIPYRTLPGNKHPKSAYFNRGTGHSPGGDYSEKPEDLVYALNRLAHKFETARSIVPGPVIDEVAGSEVGIIYYGSTWPAVDEARARLSANGLATDAMRLRALPINGDVRRFVAGHDRCYVVELNRDGQMHQILTVELPDLATRLIPLTHIDGLPLTTGWLHQAIVAKEQAL